jgi:hypothetical protein
MPYSYLTKTFGVIGSVSVGTNVLLWWSTMPAAPLLADRAYVYFRADHLSLFSSPWTYL